MFLPQCEQPSFTPILNNRGEFCYDLKFIVFQIQKKLDREEAAQVMESTAKPADSGCETMSEEEDSAELWVEKYKPKSYLELLSDEVNC